MERIDDNFTTYKASSIPANSTVQIILLCLEYTLKFAYAYVVGSAHYLFNLVFVHRKPKNIAGQVALVTGGGNGLGRAICLRLAKENCNVAVADWDFEAAEKTAADLSLLGVGSKAYKVDVRDYDQLLNLREKITKDLGSVDILVNNAGLLPLLSLHEGTPKEVETVISVNITSHLWTARIFMPGMIEKKRGHIVGIASMYGLHPAGRSILYGTTKYAVRGFMENLNEEMHLSEMNDYIHTTCVFPFFINTRQDLRDTLIRMGVEKRVIILSPEYTADVIVKAMLMNETKLTVPKGFLTPMELTMVMPGIVYRMVRNGIVGRMPTTFVNLPTADNNRTIDSKKNIVQ